MWPEVSGAAVTAVGSGGGWWWLCRHLSEPPAPACGRTPDEPKVAYAALATPAWIITITALAFVLALAVTDGQPRITWPVWMVAATCGLWQAGVDAGTTWIPKRLAHWTWAALLVSMVPVTVQVPTVAMVMAGVSAGITLVFWLVWRLGGGFGFGDVRFIPVMAAPMAWPGGGLAACAAIVGGCVLTTGLVLVDRRVSGQRRMVAWTPGFWLSLLLVAAVQALA